MVVVWGLLCGISLAFADVTVIDMAQVRVSLNGQVKPVEMTALPYYWAHHQGMSAGSAQFGMHFEAKRGDGPQAIFIPRLGTSFTIALNGEALLHYGTMPPGNWDDAAIRPWYVPLPTRLLHPNNTLEITIAADDIRGGGLARVQIGPEAEVKALYAVSHFWRVTMLHVVVGVSAILGLLGLLLWFRLRDAGYLYYGLGELLWAFATARACMDAFVPTRGGALSPVSQAIPARCFCASSSCTSWCSTVGLLQSWQL